MNIYLIVLICSQLLFSVSDILARIYMPRYGFAVGAFLTPWFLAYFCIRTIAMFGQLYVFSTTELGKTMALFGAFSIIIANGIGFLLLKETLSISTYVGIMCAILAFTIIALGK